MQVYACSPPRPDSPYARRDTPPFSHCLRVVGEMSPHPFRANVNSPRYSFIPSSLHPLQAQRPTAIDGQVDAVDVGCGWSGEECDACGNLFR